jgi:hypothetical protein
VCCGTEGFGVLGFGAGVAGFCAGALGRATGALGLETGALGLGAGTLGACFCAELKTGTAITSRSSDVFRSTFSISFVNSMGSLLMMNLGLRTDFAKPGAEFLDSHLY